MSCFDPQGSLLDGDGAGEALDSVDDLWQNYLDQLDDLNPHVAETAQFGTSPEYAISMHPQPPHQGALQFGTPPNHAILNTGLMNVQPPQLAQQPGALQFGTPPNHAILNTGSMNVQPPQLAQQPGALQYGTTPSNEILNPGSINVQPSQLAQQPVVRTLQYGTTPNHAILNVESINVQPLQLTQQLAGALQFGTTPSHAILNPGSMNVQPNQLAQQPDPPVAGALQFGTPPNHAILNPGSIRPPQLAQQPVMGTLQYGTTRNHAILNPGLINVQPPQLVQKTAGALQFGTAPNHAILNPGSMNVQPPQLAQQPGTSVSSNITNADAEKREKKRKSDWKCREKKEQVRRENAEKVVEFAKQIDDLREVNANLEKEGVKAKIKQKNDQQELSYFKDEVSRLNNKLKGQTMQVDVLSEKLVASPEATDVAEENKQLKRKIELLMTATNNPDIIKTVELQEENEKLTHENKKLRILNDALCDKLSKDKK